MKFCVMYDWCHPKNLQAFERMCDKAGIERCRITSLTEISLRGCDLLWLPDTWVSPEDLPVKVKVMYGPHYFCIPELSHPCVSLQEERSFESVEGKVFNSLCDWVVESYRECVGSFKVPFVTLPFGVDTMKFSPKPEMKKDLDFFIYYKQRDPSLLVWLKRELVTLGAVGREEDLVVIKYGSYQEDDYLNLLHRAKCAIWLGRHESQGFALQEALACNVPLLVWDVSTMLQEFNLEQNCFSYESYKNHKNFHATSAPYWDERCGERFHTCEEFRPAWREFSKNIEGYQPREFVLETVSDEACLQRWKNEFRFL